MKKWLIIAGCLMAAGLIVFSVGLGIAGFDFRRWGTQNMVTNTHTIEEDFISVRLNVVTADITFAPSEDGHVKVVCYEDSKIPNSVHVEGDTLVISTKDNRKWYDHIGFNWEENTITVYLPAGEYGDLRVDCTTGDVNVPEQFTFQNATLDLTTGDTQWKAGIGQDLSVKCTTGSVAVENVLCNSLKVKTTTGDVTLDRVQAAETMAVTVSTGDVKLNRADAGEIVIKATTGDVTGTLLSEKIFDTKVTTGDVTVPASATGGTCRVTTTTGNIDLKIAD